MKYLERIFFYTCRYFTFLGNMFPQALVCLYLMYLDFEKGFYITGLWIWGYYLNSWIKFYVARPRPDPKRQKIKISQKSHSFPSGHAFTSLTVYFPIVWYFSPDPVWTAILYALPFALGLTRVYFRVHYMSDVACGWLFAYLYLIFCEDFINYTNKYFYSKAHFIFEKIFTLLHSIGIG